MKTETLSVEIIRKITCSVTIMYDELYHEHPTAQQLSLDVKDPYDLSFLKNDEYLKISKYPHYFRYETRQAISSPELDAFLKEKKHNSVDFGTKNIEFSKMIYPVSGIEADDKGQKKIRVYSPNFVKKRRSRFALFADDEWELQKGQVHTLQPNTLVLYKGKIQTIDEVLEEE